MINIYCKTVAKGRQAYYATIDGRDYYLFEQNYRKSNNRYFGKGVELNELKRFRIFGTSMSKTIDKVLATLKYIEKEYEVVVYSRKKKKQETDRRKKPYNRAKYRVNILDLEVA